MTIELFKTPIPREFYTHVGTYKGHAVYTGLNPPKEAVAWAEKSSVCINEYIFAVIIESPKSHIFLDIICEHELSWEPYHVHKDDELSASEKELLQYLKEKRALN